MVAWKRKDEVVDVTDVSELKDRWDDQDPDLLPLFERPEIGNPVFAWDDESGPSYLLVWNTVEQNYSQAVLANDDVVLQRPNGGYVATTRDTLESGYELVS